MLTIVIRSGGMLGDCSRPPYEAYPLAGWGILQADMPRTSNRIRVTNIPSGLIRWETTRRNRSMTTTKTELKSKMALARIAGYTDEQTTAQMGNPLFRAPPTTLDIARSTWIKADMAWRAAGLATEAKESDHLGRWGTGCPAEAERAEHAESWQAWQDADATADAAYRIAYDARQVYKALWAPVEDPGQ